MLSSLIADDEDRKGSRADVGRNDWAEGHDEDLVNGRIFQEALLEGLGTV